MQWLFDIFVAAIPAFLLAVLIEIIRPGMIIGSVNLVVVLGLLIFLGFILTLSGPQTRTISRSLLWLDWLLLGAILLSVIFLFL